MKTTPKTPKTPLENRELISISLSGLACATMVVTTMAHVEPTGRFTPKAVEVEGRSPRGKRVTAWLPRWALVPANEAEDYFRLHPRFKPSDWQSTFLDLTKVEAFLTS